MAWTSPRTWIAGEKPTAATMNTHIRDNLQALTEYQSYTPVVTGASATATGKYISAGKLVIGYFRVTFTGAATSTVVMTLPVLALLSSNNDACGTCVMLDTSVGSGSRRSGTIMHNSAGTCFFNVDSLASAAAVTTAVPWTWASGDSIGGQFYYEAA